MSCFELGQKRYLKVRVDYLPDGRVIPLMYRAGDEPRVVIDQIIDVRAAPSWKTGGHGIRYTCRIGERFVYLFQEKAGWFVESL